MSTIELEGLRIAYGSRVVVPGLTCTLPGRGVTALLGPSGCGKSTVLKAIDRTLELAPGVRIEGKVRVFGDDVYSRGVDPRVVRRRVGIVHQRPTCFPMSILENVIFGARFHRLARGAALRALAERCLREAGLFEEVRERLDEPASRLSGGQQQRLCIARALATGPEVLLMDEPTSALDATAAARIEELAGSLAADRPIVIVTHDVGQARRLADRVVLLREGRLVASGDVAEVFGRPSGAKEGSEEWNRVSERSASSSG